MHNISSDTDWSFLVSRSLLQACVGSHQIQLHFDNDTSINIEGAFELSAQLFQRGDDPILRGRAVLALLGASIVKVSQLDPNSVTVTFTQGDTLKLINDKEFESFEIMSPRARIIA